MRIGLFSDNYPPQVSGVSTSVLMLKKALEKKGHTVYVVTTSINSSTKYSVEENGKVLRVPGIPTGIYDYRLTGAYPVRMINTIRKWKLDVIHSQTEFGIGMCARAISKQFNIPLVHTYHTMYEDYVHYITKGYFPGLSKKIVEYLTLFYYDKIPEIIVPTKKTYDLFKFKYNINSNINIIPTGIEIERFYKENVNQKEVKKLKEQLGFKETDFIVLYVGRIAAEKSIPFLIEVHRDLVKSCPNMKLLIVGDGPDRESYEELVKKYKINDSVTFTGKIMWDRIPLYYSLADVFATASVTETQGLTVVEAMASGAMPICINDESFNTTVIDDLNGFIFNNKKEYKEKLLRAYKNPETVKRLSKQARISVEKFSSKYFAERVLDVYKRAIENHKEKFDLLGAISGVLKRNKNEEDSDSKS